MTWGDLQHYLTDAQFSVVAVMDAGKLPGYDILERVKYTPYGFGLHCPPGDYNGGGYTNWVDYSVDFAGQYGSGTLMSDFNRSGTRSSDDVTAFATAWYAADPDAPESSGWVSHPDAASGGHDNTIGYCGYIFNPETGDYTVRFRTYMPSLGRWGERDPASFVTGMNLIEYCRSDATTLTDLDGQQPAEPVKEASPPPQNDPRNDKAKGCGITVKRNDIGNGYGHQWIVIDDPGHGHPGDKDWRPAGKYGLGRYPRGVISPYSDAPDCESCRAQDPATTEEGDTIWDTTLESDENVHVWEADWGISKVRLRYGNAPGTQGKLPSEATCEDIRRCLLNWRSEELYDYTGHIYGENCRTASGEAINNCGLFMVNKRRTEQGKKKDEEAEERAKRVHAHDPIREPKW